MFETPITIVGTIVTDPIHRSVGEQELFKFRLASNSRRRSAEGEWEQGNSLYVTVNCWGRLVTGTAAVTGEGRSGDRRRASLHERVRGQGWQSPVVGRGACDVRGTGSRAQHRANRTHQAADRAAASVDGTQDADEAVDEADELEVEDEELSLTA